MTNATFVKGLVACVALMLAFGGVIAILNAGNNRPEGVAEDWLTAVGDTVRNGVEDDARKRASKIGPLALAARIVTPNPDGDAAFASLEVGKAVERSDDLVNVRYRVHARVGGDEVPRQGVIELRRVDDDWKVTDVAEAGFEALPELPSEGGPPPSSAPATMWVGALVGAAVVGLVCSALVRAT